MSKISYAEKQKDHAFIRPVANDGMPKQVATELLCDPLARLTAPMRRSAMAARWNLFTSTQPKRPPEEKLVRKIHAAKINQVYKWLKRAKERRMECQRAFLRVTGTTPLHDRLRAALEFKAAACDIMREVCEAEIADRATAQKEYAKQKEERAADRAPL